MAEEELLDIARANHSGRKFRLTLLQLCLKVVAGNESFFIIRASQSAILGNMVLHLKSRLLAELSRRVCDVELLYPATKHRVAMVKKLIHPRLEQFDFVVLGNKFGKATNQQVWQCLAEKAGAQLLSVLDLRVKNQTLRNRTLEWCLPYLSMMPNISKLRLTTLCCYSDDLDLLLEAVPKLKILQLLVHSSFELDEIEALIKHKSIEELILDGCDEKKGEIVKELLWEMPQLKVNSVRCDQLYQHPGHIFHRREANHWTRDSYDLQHCSVKLNSADERFLNQRFCKVRHLMVTENYLRKAVDYTEYVDQLQTLYIRNCRFDFHQTVLTNGRTITTLILEAPEFDQEERFFDLFNVHWILTFCKNLTSLTMCRAVAAFHYNVEFGDFPIPVRGTFQLRKLHLVNGFFMHCEFLHWLLLSAPFLEYVSFHRVSHFREADDVFHSSTLAVADGLCLTELRRFQLSLHSKANRLLRRTAYMFAKAILVCCPELSQAAVELRPEDRRELKHTLKPLLDLVNA